MAKVCIVGNPNVGKTAVLNLLSGSSYTVGNWAGVTVARQEGSLVLSSKVMHLLDLPGLYSLAPCSEDEGISSREIFFSQVDLFINVIDVNNLSQNMMLSVELSELNVPIIGLLNFFDEFDASYSLNVEALSQELGYPLIPFSARTKVGLEPLKKILQETSDFSVFKSKNRVCTDKKYDVLSSVFDKYTALLPLAKFSSALDKTALLAQMMIGNDIILKKMHLPLQDFDNIINEHGDILPDFTQDVLDKKEILVRSANIQLKEGKKDPARLTRAVDRVLLHPIWGMVSFSVIIALLFSMVFNASNPFIDYIDWLIGVKFSGYASLFLSDASPVLQSFVTQGIIGGVGGVLTFVPLIFVLYTFLAFLEESGYLARIAVLLEAPFSKIGLSGKAFLPLMLGFGCNVPAIYGTRVLETPQQRRLAAMLASLVSCGARLTVFALFSAAFFPDHGALVLLSLYFLGIILAVGFGWLFSRTLHFKSSNPCFVIVLPPYRVPHFGIVVKTAWRHAGSYIKKASGIILGMLMLIWAVGYFPEKGDISKSYLAKAGKVIYPLFVPLGFGERWEIVMAIIPSLVAKEAVVGFLGQTLNADVENVEEEALLPLEWQSEIKEIFVNFTAAIGDSVKGLFNFFSLFTPPNEEELEEEGGRGIIAKLQSLWETNAPLKAYSFMLFILLTLPCVTAIAALKQELDKKTFIWTLVLYTFLPYFVSLIFYQTAKLFT